MTKRVPLVAAGVIALLAACWLHAAGAEPKEKSVKLSSKQGKGKIFPPNSEFLKVAGHDAYLAMPEGVKAGRKTPWLWYCPSDYKLPGRLEQWMMKHCLDNGVAVAGIDLRGDFGTPAGRKIQTAFYKELTDNHGVTAKVSMLARSYGATQMYNWAVEHPESIACLAGIYPVCNLESYPGLKSAAGKYKMSQEEFVKELKRHNPIDRLAPLAKAKVPIYHNTGDIDTLVPPKDNTFVVEGRYRALGGDMTVTVFGGQGHNYWTGFFEDKAMAEFIIKHTAKAAALPKVLFFGDSISGGYSKPLTKLMEGKAEMVKLGAVATYRINDEAWWHSSRKAKALDFGSAKACIADLERFERHLSETSYDVIHFNFGLNDIFRGRNGAWHNPVDQYAKDLETIVTLLKKNGAKIIWSTITPIPANAPHNPEGDDLIYNAAAEKVMKENDIPINDLHSLVTQWGGYDEWRKGNDVHFSGGVYRKLAEQIATTVLTQLDTLTLCLLPVGSLSFGGERLQKRLLWSDQPVVFTETQAGRFKYQKDAWSQKVFPLGNGRLGCTVFGDPRLERIQFNEDSLWVGNEDNTGGYQPFGDLYVRTGNDDFSDYRRELDISRAVQTVTYRSGGVNFKREYFSSYPAQVMVYRFTADKKGALSGKVWLDHVHRSATVKEQLRNPKAGDAITTRAKDNTITMAGSTADLFFWQLILMPEQKKKLSGLREYASDKNIDLDLEAQVRVLNDGGEIKVDGDSIVFENCNSLTILLGADTSYLNQRDKGWRGEHPHKRISAQLDVAEKRSYKEMLEEHVKDYQSIYGRFELSLGDTPKALSALPTAQRVQEYREQYKETGRTDDRDLETLIYQYARYLMISCSRPGHGGMPANLQGLWLYHFRPAWRCDYHTDINLQMNYWFVDQANLSECFVPLAEWLDSIREVRKEETRKVLGVDRGWLMRSENGVFGGSTYHFQKGDSAWISQNLWDHYAFSQDREYLKRYAYPVMKEISEFWLDHLKALPNGKLVIPDGRSPEHGPEKADGVSYDQQLCWDLFNNTIEASDALVVDVDFRKLLVEKRDKLLGPKVGKWGQLQEWMADIDRRPGDRDRGHGIDPLHRHVSHMLAVYPGRQIHPTITPAFADAAKVSVVARGNGKTGWSKVFKSCVFGRLLDAENAYRLLSDVILTKTHGNLWTTHPPFQIDCNFGYAAAVNEMLVQSHLRLDRGPNTQVSRDPKNSQIAKAQGEPLSPASEHGTVSPEPYIIHLLPALPKAWPDGTVRGVRVRGGYELDLAWKDGALTAGIIRNQSAHAKSCVIRYDGRTTEVKLDANGSFAIEVLIGGASQAQ